MISTMTATAIFESQAESAPSLLNQAAVAARQAAWLLEMEREQVQDWLQHPLLPQQSSLLQMPFAPRFLEDKSQQANDDSAIAHDAVQVNGNGMDDSHFLAAGAHGSVGNDGAQDWMSSVDTDGNGVQSVAEADSSVMSGQFSDIRNTEIAVDKLPVADDSASASTGTRLTTVAAGLQKILEEWTQPSLQFVWNTRSSSEKIQNQENTVDAIDEAGVDSAHQSEEASQSLDVDGGSLRFHAEASGNNARVWIGADSSIALSDNGLMKIGAEIERLLRQQGMTLQSLVCNGTALLREGRYADLRNVSEQGEDVPSSGRSNKGNKQFSSILQVQGSDGIQ